jgi:hypothetical protein
VARVNILKQIKFKDRWKLVAIPKNRHGRRDWKALAEGRYFIEWYEGGKRQAAGVTVAQAQEVARRRKRMLEASPRLGTAHLRGGKSNAQTTAPSCGKEIPRSH